MKKKILTILLATTMVFSLAGCGSSTEAEVSKPAETEVESVVEEAEPMTEVSEQDDTEGIKVAIQEGKYDEALRMLDEAKAGMEVEEYAIQVSNVHLYKNDYVAAADILVEKINETDSQVLKDRLEYIRENIRLIEAKYYDESGSLSYTNVYEYDDNGNEVKRTEYDVDGNILSSRDFEYDEKGNETKYSQVYSDGVSLCFIFENTYNSNGILSSVTTCDENGEISYVDEYDNSGNVILQTTYQEGNPFSYYKYTYDDKGNEMSLEFGYIARELEGYLISYEYTEENGITKKVGYNQEGSINSIVQYDDNGNELKNDSIGLVMENKYNSLNDAIYSGTVIDEFSSAYNIENTYEFVGEIK